MKGWGTSIQNLQGERLCMGWITDYELSAGYLFEGEIISSKDSGGYPDEYTITVKSLRAFCADPKRYSGLTKNIFGSWDFSQPFDPQLVLDAINELSDDDQVVIIEFDQD